MRPSIVPRQAFAVAHLCSTCRREAVRRNFTTSPFSSVAAGLAPTVPRSDTNSNRRAPALPTRRGFAQSARCPQPPSPSAVGSEASPGSAHPHPPPRPRAGPAFYVLFPRTLGAGPPPSGPFHIDVRELRREFLRLQAAAHPDVAGGSTEASAQLNEGFRTLASPLLRALYLLRERHGVDLAGDEAGALAVPEPDVLAAVMEAREAVEEARAEAELEGPRAENEDRIRAAEEVLGEAFARGDVEAAKREVVRLRYWMNVRESIDNWEEGKRHVLEH